MFLGTSIIGSVIHYNEWFQVRNIIFYSLFFFMGIVMSQERILKNINLIAIFLLIAIGLIFFFWGNEKSLNKIPIVNIFIAIGISLFLMYIFEFDSFITNNGLFQLCGKYCLEIYVIHCFLTSGNRVVLPKMGIHNAYMNVIINFAISISVPIAFSWCCQKLKIHDLFFKPYSFMKAYIKTDK
ncbi:MAG: hypothetical protein PHY47_20720 [Lachnospiraceae bacterium]|nr:hypothetical protein [Lachnospiraceae bacterium]